MNKRLYLDYNATAPIAEPVLDWFSNGALPFANPSSIHHSGKRSKKLISETSLYLKDIFKLKYHEIFYHSGATEGINDIFKGFAFSNMGKNRKFHIVCLATDHSCVINQEDHIKLLGGGFHTMDVDRNGDPNLEKIIKYIKNLEGEVLFNFTYVNNESGIILPLKKAAILKKETGCLVHVDAVQLIGKTQGSLELEDSIDFYTFSGHKFGSMKGIGFSFAKNCLEDWCPLIRGGGQQLGMRSGTENVHGIYSLKIALETILAKQDTKKVQVEKEALEALLLKEYKDLIEIAGLNNRNRNTSTFYFIIKNIKIEVLLTALDMAKIEVSSGSACSSGIVKASRVLCAMGYSLEDAKSGIRISLGNCIEVGAGSKIFEKLKAVLDRFLK